MTAPATVATSTGYPADIHGRTYRDIWLMLSHRRDELAFSGADPRMLDLYDRHCRIYEAAAKRCDRLSEREHSS